MTGQTPDHPARRVGDRGVCARALAWFKRWKDLIVAVVLLPTAAATVFLGVKTYALQSQRASDAQIVRELAQAQAASAEATAKAAKVQCQRSRVLGPKLADYYARDPLFPRDVLEQYRRTIPKTCPK